LAEWHLITGEYPPQPGGVSDYSRWVASALAAAGDVVHVWCPQSGTANFEDTGVIVHRELGTMGPRDLFKAGMMLDKYPGPRRLLVQWVPHAFGFRSANLPLSLWIWNRAFTHKDRVEVMVHEPFLPLSQDRLRHSALAVVHRIMLTMVLRAASRIWVAIPKWEDCCRLYAGSSASFTWLPVISNISVNENSGAIETVRATYASSRRNLIGHFGTCGGAIGEMLQVVIPKLLSRSADRVFLLIGEDGRRTRNQILQQHPSLRERIHVTGLLSDAEVSWHISACDAMLQPYPDGASSRRGSLMAGISHGKPVVTTSGDLTEPLWQLSGAVVLAPAGNHSQLVTAVENLLACPSEMVRLGKKAKDWYRRCFDLQNLQISLRTDGNAHWKAGLINCEDMANADSTNY
jgi:hypothetical protein